MAWYLVKARDRFTLLHLLDAEFRAACVINIGSDLSEQ